jgi:hypothetical protein
MTDSKVKQNSSLPVMGLLAAAAAVSLTLAFNVSSSPIAHVIQGTATDIWEWTNWPKRNLKHCQRNVNNIALAVEMYSTDNAGRYPKSLAILVPNYLARIPQCPSAMIDSYSGTLQTATNPDAFTIYCRGNNHSWAKAPPNFPLAPTP